MKNVLGLLASGAATIALLISICIYDNTSEWNVLTLLALLAGGLCTILRLLDVIGGNGSLVGNKKQLAILIVVAALLSGAFNFGAFVWNTERWVEYHLFERIDLVGGKYVFAWVCLILAGAANLINLLVGCLQVKEAGQQPKPAANQPATVYHNNSPA